MRGSHLVAALGITGPSGRFRLDGLVQEIALVKDFAARPSKSVGKARVGVAAHYAWYDLGCDFRGFTECQHSIEPTTWEAFSVPQNS